MPAPLCSQTELRGLLEEVRAIYRELSQVSVERSCILRTGCCNFQLTGKTPYLTKGEAMVAARALKASGRKRLPECIDGACPLLDPRTSRCLIYDSRPIGCRTHFCSAAGGPLARRDVADFIRRLEEIDARLGGNGATNLPTALQNALRLHEKDSF